MNKVIYLTGGRDQAFSGILRTLVEYCYVCQRFGCDNRDLEKYFLATVIDFYLLAYIHAMSVLKVICVLVTAVSVSVKIKGN